MISAIAYAARHRKIGVAAFILGPTGCGFHGDGADAAARLDGEDLLDLIRKGSVSADDEDAGADGEAGSQETSA
jgi:hypothetical protein